MKTQSALLTFILMFWISSLQILAQTKAVDPFVISGFNSRTLQEWFFFDSNGKKFTTKIFKVSFKINDPSITSIQTARIYLYDKDKVLIDTLRDIKPKGKRPDGIEDYYLNVPNMITSLTDLKANAIYYLIFPYTDAITWKYAIFVLGTEEQVMADTLPASAKVVDFDFKEKDKLVK